MTESSANSFTVAGNDSPPPGLDPRIISGTNQLFLHQFNRLAPIILGAPMEDNVGPTSLITTGQGRVVLSRNSSISGEVVIGSGTLQIGNGGTTGGVGGFVSGITNNGILAFARTGGSTVINSVISGTGSIRQVGTNLVLLNNNNNSFSGRLNVLSGSLLASSLGSTDGGTSVEAGASLEFSGIESKEFVTLKGGAFSTQGGRSSSPALAGPSGQPHPAQPLFWMAS